MRDLELIDLHNPNSITGILHTNDGFVEMVNEQGFQELPKSIELWQKLPDGRLMRVKRWWKKCILATYKDA